MDLSGARPRHLKSEFLSTSALAAIEENIDFYRAIKNVYLYLCGSGGEPMRSRRKDFVFQMLPQEFAQLR